MHSRFVRPQSVTLPISHGDTITVKRRLTHGEHTDINTRLTMNVDGLARMNPAMLPYSRAIAYLLDWSITDDSGRRVDIVDKSPDEVLAILRAMESDDYDEIADAILKHERAMNAERAAEKNGQGGETKLPATSPSLDAAAGGTSGSAT
jgi:hypothetical protein